MPREDSLLRLTTEARARRGRDHGVVMDTGARVTQRDPTVPGVRGNARFDDVSQYKTWWELRWGGTWEDD